MFLTRLGYDSKAVVTGDVTQVDLPQGARAAWPRRATLLADIDGIAFCHFTEVDVVRHPLVQKIIVAYEARDAQAREAREARRARSQPAREANEPMGAEGVTPRGARTRARDGSSSRSCSRRDARFAADSVTRPHALLVTAWRTLAAPNGRAQERLCVVIAPAAVWDRGRELLAPFARQASPTARRCSSSSAARPTRRCGEALNRGLAAVLAADARRRRALRRASHRAFELLEAKARAESRGKWLNRYRYELGELIEIAHAMTTERDVDKLLGVILEKSRFVTGADAGSIYVVEPATRATATAGAPLQAHAERLACSFDSREFTMPLSRPVDRRRARRSRRAAQHRRRLRAAARLAVRLRPRASTERIGYRTQSMLVRAAHLASATRSSASSSSSTRSATRRRSSSTRERRRRAGRPLRRAQRGAPRDARRAGRHLARERDPLRGDPPALRGLREARASRRSSRAIRRRAVTRAASPISRSASRRSSTRESTGPYRDATFSRARTCASSSTRSLLHDFGKIGVREKVLVKAKKLYDERLELHPRALRLRRAHASRSTCSRASSRALERGAPRERARRARRRARRSAAPSSTAPWRRCSSANEPTVLDGRRLRAHRGDREGDVRRPPRRGAARCSTDDEVACLRVSTRLAHAAGVRRDPHPRLAHVPLPLADPVGQGVPPRPASSPARTTSASTARATRTACAPRRSRCSRR